jgi:hypothetical protein
LGHEDLDKWVEDAPPLTHDEIVYRVEHGNRGVKAIKELHVGSTWTLGTSASESIRGIIKGVLEPGEKTPEEACIFEIHLPKGKSWGRPVRHSDRHHPENIQEEFLLRKGIQVRVIKIYEPDPIDKEDHSGRIDTDNYRYFVVKPI